MQALCSISGLTLEHALTITPFAVSPSSYGVSTAFFTLVRAHTIEGTFCDPYYGGNANFVGWDLIGYPGVRTIVSADDQRLGADLPSNHKSAYDYDMFNRASASAPHATEMARGD